MNNIHGLIEKSFILQLGFADEAEALSELEKSGTGATSFFSASISSATNTHKIHK